jgi:BsuBI/PstI restriction endonuclease domain
MNLIPGEQSKWPMAVIEKFGLHFAPGATILYLGDKANKFVIYERERLEQLGISTTAYNKLPDIILYNEARNWLFLIDAGISHKAVTRKRRIELEALFQKCSAFRIYISAFLNYAAYSRYMPHIAWETHIWIAEIPEHMIHFDGEQFISLR